MTKEKGEREKRKKWIKERSNLGVYYAVVAKSLSSLNSFRNKINIKRQVIFSPNLLVELIIKCCWLHHQNEFVILTVVSLHI